MYPQGVCRIRKPAHAGNGCAIFSIFQIADWGQKIHCPAADDLFRTPLEKSKKYNRRMLVIAIVSMLAAIAGLLLRCWLDDECDTNCQE